MERGSQMSGGSRFSRGFSVFSVSVCALAQMAFAAEVPVVFEYGGDASSLKAVMNEAGDGAGGAGVFADAGFDASFVNVFVVDLRDCADLGGAGVTLFAMWGNGEKPGSEFWADIVVTPPDPFGNPLLVGHGDGESFSDGSEVFALGEGVTAHSDLVSVFGEVPFGDQTPRGFAITNLQGMEPGELSMLFDLGGSISTVGLFDWGDPNPFIPPTDMALLSVLVPIPIPLPPAVALGAAGLIGVAVLRRRLAS